MKGINDIEAGPMAAVGTRLLLSCTVTAAETRSPVTQQNAVRRVNLCPHSPFRLWSRTISDLSMGVMMKGIVERPIAVVVHFRTGRGHLVVLPSRCRDAAHTRLMVKPGMMTEARACHTKVSTTATATLVVFPGLSP